MKPEGKSKIQSLISDLSGLKSRNPEESRLKDWKDKTEKRLEGSFRGSWIVCAVELAAICMNIQQMK
jgi:hypothetical protein